MNTRLKGIIICCVFAFTISSCRFSMPLVKWNHEEYNREDTLGNSVVMEKNEAL